MTPSNFIPAIWSYFFGGGAPAPDFVVVASPGDSPHRATLSASCYVAAMASSLYAATLPASKYAAVIPASLHRTRLARVYPGWVWENVVGCSVDAARKLTKTTVLTGWGDAGAVSSRQLLSGDGWVEAEVLETNKGRQFGLTNKASCLQPSDIAFTLHLSSAGLSYSVWENGVGVFPPVAGAYAVGDVFRVAVESGAVKYYKNGVLRYTSLIAPTYPLRMGTVLYSPGATIVEPAISFAPADEVIQV